MLKTSNPIAFAQASGSSAQQGSTFPPKNSILAFLFGFRSQAFEFDFGRKRHKKGQYVYYRCTQSRGKCDLPYIREEELGDRLGAILKDIHIPDNILAQLRETLLSEQGRQDGIRAQQTSLLQQRLTQVNRRMDQAYMDKLDGRISDEFWSRNSAEWQAEEQRVFSFNPVSSNG